MKTLGALEKLVLYSFWVWVYTAKLQYCGRNMGIRVRKHWSFLKLTCNKWRQNILYFDRFFCTCSVFTIQHDYKFGVRDPLAISQLSAIAFWCSFRCLWPSRCNQCVSFSAKNVKKISQIIARNTFGGHIDEANLLLVIADCMLCMQVAQFEQSRFEMEQLLLQCCQFRCGEVALLGCFP